MMNATNDIKLEEQETLLLAQSSQYPLMELALVGEGEPVVMFSGLLLPFVSWDYQLPVLSKNYQLIIPHTPGCGRSQLAKDKLALSYIAEQVHFYLKKLIGSQSYTVIGYSFGGFLAQTYATLFPQEMKQLILCCTAAKLSNLSLDYKEIMLEFNQAGDFLSRKNRILQAFRSWRQDLFADYGILLKNFDMTSKLKDLSCPVSIIGAKEDRYIPIKYVYELAQAANTDNIISIEGGAHLSLMTQEKAFNNALLNCLKGIKPAAKTTISHDDAPKINSVYKPVSAEVLKLYTQHIQNGNFGGASYANAAQKAQLSYLFNCLLKVYNQRYCTALLTSMQESVDCAFRLARHKAKTLKPEANGLICIYDPDEFFANHYYPGRLVGSIPLIPNMTYAKTIQEVATELKTKSCCLCVLDSSLSVDIINKVFAYCKKHNILTALIQKNCLTQPLACRQLEFPPNIVVFDESMTDNQVPFGAMLALADTWSVWRMSPEDGLHRDGLTSFGTALETALHFFLKEHSNLLTAENKAIFQDIENNEDTYHKISLEYYNPGFVESLQRWGWSGVFSKAKGFYSDYQLKNRKERIIDAYSLCGGAMRGYNSDDVIPNVLQDHDLNRDYFAELANYFKKKTGLSHAFPSLATSLSREIALNIGVMASLPKQKIITFCNNGGWSLITSCFSNESADPGEVAQNLFHSSFGPFSKEVIFVNPYTSEGPKEFEAYLNSGEIGMVWLEPLQFPAGGHKLIPSSIYQLINRYKKNHPLTVVVDHSQCGLHYGKFIEDELDEIDVVAYCGCLCDSLITVGIVLANEKSYEKAKKVNQESINFWENRYKNQFSAHIALNVMEHYESLKLGEYIAHEGAWVKEQFDKIVTDYDHVKAYQGSGFLPSIEFDLIKPNYHPFLIKYFGYMFWETALKHKLSCAVYPIRSNGVRFMLPTCCTREDLELFINRLRSILDLGVKGVIQSNIEWNHSIGNERIVNFFEDMLKKI